MLESGVVAHIYSLSTWEAEAGGFQVWSQPGINSKTLFQKTEGGGIWMKNDIWYIVPDSSAFSKSQSHMQLKLPSKEKEIFIKLVFQVLVIPSCSVDQNCIARKAFETDLEF
jgi:hypothetical protein